MSLNCCAMTGVKSQDRVVRRKVRRIFKAKQIEKNKKNLAILHGAKASETSHRVLLGDPASFGKVAS